MTKLPDKDFIRCKKCGLAVNNAEIDFIFYANLPRFVEKCKNCEYGDRKLFEKPKEDLINSIKIAETFHGFAENKLKELEDKVLDFHRTTKSELHSYNEQLNHKIYTLTRKLNSLDEAMETKYVTLERYDRVHSVTDEIINEHHTKFSDLYEFLEVYLGTDNRDFIDFSVFPSALRKLLKSKFIFLISQLREIGEKNVYINRLGARSFTRIKDYLKTIKVKK